MFLQFGRSNAKYFNTLESPRIPNYSIHLPQSRATRRMDNSTAMNEIDSQYSVKLFQLHKAKNI